MDINYMCTSFAYTHSLFISPLIVRFIHLEGVFLPEVVLFFFEISRGSTGVETKYSICFRL